MTCVIASVFMTVSNIPWVCMYCGHCINDRITGGTEGGGGGNNQPVQAAWSGPPYCYPPSSSHWGTLSCSLLPPSFLLRPDLKPVVVEPEVTLRCDLNSLVLPSLTGVA